MTAIQRWYFYPLDEHGQELRQVDGNEFADDELYCKAADVAQIELLLKRYLEDLATSRQSRDRAKADLAIADAKIKSLEAEMIQREIVTDQLLNHCDKQNGECSRCGEIVCPFGDGMYFHHDGCPSCGSHDEQITGT